MSTIPNYIGLNVITLSAIENLLIPILLTLKKQINMYKFHHYVIDWEKVKTQEDIITILKELNIAFDNPSEDMKKLCKYVNKSDGCEVKLD